MKNILPPIFPKREGIIKPERIRLMPLTGQTQVAFQRKDSDISIRIILVNAFISCS